MSNERLSGLAALPPLEVGGRNLNLRLFLGAMSVQVSNPELVAAVANGGKPPEDDAPGGAGTLGGVGRGLGREKYAHYRFFEADLQALADDLHQARRLSPKGVIGVNILAACTDAKNLIKKAAENGADYIAVGAGVFRNLTELTANHPRVTLIPIVSTVQGLRVVCKMMNRENRKNRQLPPIVIYKAPRFVGGHLGLTRKHTLDSPEITRKIVIPQSREWLKKMGYDDDVTLIAAGGIRSREDVEEVLDLGAEGISIASRFVTARESNVQEPFKQVYFDSGPGDSVIIPSPVGLPARAFRTDFADSVVRGDEVHQDLKCRYNCLRRCSFRESRGKKDFCIVEALREAIQGDVQKGIVFAGSKAYLAKRETVADIFDELTAR